MRDGNFEVGEEVFIDSSRYGGTQLTPVTVKRITKTLAIVEVNGVERKFAQRDGRQVPAGEWHTSQLRREDEDIRHKLSVEHSASLLSSLMAAAQKVHPLEPTVEQANAVHRAYYEWVVYKIEGAE